MDLFEFILIITSVIYAMGVAQILAGVSRLAQTSVTIRWYLPHALWTLILFVYIFLVWWSAWEFRDLHWTFPLYLYMALAPTLAFFACSLLIPQAFGETGLDLESHFNRIRKPFLSAFLLATLAAVLDGTVLADEPLWFPTRVGHIALIGTVFLGLFTDNKKVQTTIAAVAIAALVYITVTRLWNPR